MEEFEQEVEKPKLNLWQKIAQARELIGVVKKEGKVAFKSTNYNYQRAEDIELAVREALMKVGLVLLPTEFYVEADANNIITTVQTYRLVDTDNGEYVHLAMGGMGQDSGDKRIYKAETGAFKYLLKQLFMIPSEDTDPDLIPSGAWEQEKSLTKAAKSAESDININWRDYVMKSGKQAGKSLGQLVDEGNTQYIKFMSTVAGAYQPYCQAAVKELGL